MVQATWRTIWQFLQVLYRVTYDPVIPHPVICPREIKTYLHTKTYNVHVHSSIMNNTPNNQNVHQLLDTGKVLYDRLLYNEKE